MPTLADLSDPGYPLGSKETDVAQQKKDRNFHMEKLQEISQETMELDKGMAELMEMEERDAPLPASLDIIGTPWTPLPGCSGYELTDADWQSINRIMEARRQERRKRLLRRIARAEGNDRSPPRKRKTVRRGTRVWCPIVID